MKESYQRSVLSITEFTEDDVIATSGPIEQKQGPFNVGTNGMGIALGPSDGAEIRVPGGFY
ncbi:MAG: hypothetical protein IJG87_06770 [Ruminococcus sp.]|nr:hypothetical protein [Ruminococcus sp.]